ncbi:MAG: 16S rRNA (guanine(527)-N(7))-methyltransferase RsmG [Pelagimonas sp.]|jgi:16S rRNA (guanine527-N7)-methyltransferase|nr:16S rRNA (guanine(527)-N(7))-methyltransferase RsmG [Pelagimonas sp.]
MTMTLGDLSVSRETIQDLSAYRDLLEKWNPKINLVAKSTLKEAWHRHFLDSAQIYSLAGQNVQTWVDLGSGGGFPGLVVATLAKEKSPRTKFHLIESDQRKSAFLRTVIRELHLNATVYSKRIEDVSDLKADVISARALASLTDLIGFSQHLLTKDGTALFMKGESWGKELEIAKETWRFEHKTHKSLTEENAVILELKDLIHD